MPASAPAPLRGCQAHPFMPLLLEVAERMEKLFLLNWRLLSWRANSNLDTVRRVSCGTRDGAQGSRPRSVRPSGAGQGRPGAGSPAAAAAAQHAPILLPPAAPLLYCPTHLRGARQLIQGAQQGHELPRRLHQARQDLGRADRRAGLGAVHRSMQLVIYIGQPRCRGGGGQQGRAGPGRGGVRRQGRAGTRMERRG